MKFISPKFEFLNAPDQTEALQLLDQIARICQKSEGKATDDIESKTTLIRRIIDSGHALAIEHFTITVLATCDQGVSHELVGYRIASYRQDSTRYCNYSKDGFGTEIAYVDLTEGLTCDKKVMGLSSDQVYAIYGEWMDACIDAECHYMKMIELGATPQIARSVLNNSTKTEIAITMNLREWRQFFKLRTAPGVHPQMRELIEIMLNEFEQRFPVFFAGLRND